MSQYVVRKQFGLAGQSVWPGQVIDDESLGDTAGDLVKAGFMEALEGERVEERGESPVAPAPAPASSPEQVALIPEASAAETSKTDDSKGKRKA